MGGFLQGNGAKTSTGKSVINGFDTTGTSYAFANLMKMAGDMVPDTANYPFPGYLDSNGYPNNAPGNVLGSNINCGLPLPPVWGSQSLVFKFKGTGGLYLQDGGGGNLNLGSYTVTGGTDVVDTSTSNFIKVTGTDVRVLFSFATAPLVGGNYRTIFLSGATYSGFNSFVLCRLSDEAAIDADPNAFNPDFLNQLLALNPRTIRFLNWSGVASHTSRFSQRPASGGAFSYFAQRYPFGGWVGSASGTGTSGSPYICSLPATWSGLVDGAMITVQFTNANTATQPLINVGSTGNVRMTDPWPNDLGAGAIGAGDIWTFTYSSIYNYWTGVKGGFDRQVPIEAMVSLCNRTGAHLWMTIPHRYRPSDGAALASVVKASLNPGLKFYVEMSNEVWNAAQQNTTFIKNVGLLFGFYSQVYGAHGLLHCMMMSAVTTAWGGADARLRRVLAFQAYGPTGTGGDTNIYLLQGQELAPSGTHTGTGNAAYVTYTGGADYTQRPNRPVDQTDVLSYATYYAGGEILQFDNSYIDAHNAGLNVTNLTTAADNYAAGGAGIETAMNWVDSDMRQGLQSNSVVGGSTMPDFVSNIYPAWETIAAAYDADRPVGLSALTVECYEGGHSSSGPTTSTCTAIGIATAYSVKIGNLITAYKNNPRFEKLVTDQFNQFLTSSHSTVPAWYVIQGPAPWAHYSGDCYTGPQFTGVYYSWNANVKFNH